MPVILDDRQLRFVTAYVAQPLAAGRDGDLRGAVTAFRRQLGEDVALLGDPDLGAIDTLIAGGDPETALSQMQRIAEAMAAARGTARQADAAGTIPAGMVADMARTLELGIATLRTNRLRTVAGLEELTRRLRDEEDGDLHRIADRVDGLRKGLPEQLEATLGRMKASMDAGEIGQVAAEKATALGLVGEAAAFLKDNEKELALCEENPFGIAMDVVGPLTEAVTSVRQSLARL